jgi:hypothetical protein
MSDRNLIDRISRHAEKRYEHLQEASQEELIKFALTEFEASQPFKEYRDMVTEMVTRITLQSVNAGEIERLQYLNQTPEDYDMIMDTYFNQTPEDYDMIMAAYTQVLLEGHQLSSAASRDLGQRLAGKIKRPRRKPGAKPKVNKNQIICRVISILQRYANIPPKRNEASDGFSGSDVVAEALQRSGIKSQTPRGVAEIWRRHGKGFR